MDPLLTPFPPVPPVLFSTTMLGAFYVLRGYLLTPGSGKHSSMYEAHARQPALIQKVQDVG